MAVQLFLTYCSDHEQLAQELAQKLGRADIQFDLISDKTGTGLPDQIGQSGKNGLLFISDNFLKSEVCMEGMLAFIQHSPVAQRSQFVIIDGEAPAGEDGKTVAIPTTFERVSNVIRYMNHWQDKYLDLRRQKRDIAPDEADAFEERLQKVKQISTEIGEFLRLLRAVDYWSFDQLCYNDFELFFKKYDAQSYAKYQKAAEADNEKVAVVEEQQTNGYAGADVSNLAPPDVEQNITVPSRDQMESVPSPVEETSDLPQIQNEKEDPELGDQQKEEEITPPANPILRKVIEYRTNQNTPESETEEEVVDEQEEAPAIDEVELTKNVEIEEETPAVLEDVFLEDEEIEELDEEEIELPDDFDPMEGLEVEDDGDDEDDEAFSDEEIQFGELPERDTEELEPEAEHDMDTDEESLAEVPELEEDQPSASPAVATAEAKRLIEEGHIAEGATRFESLISEFPEMVDIQYTYAKLLTEHTGDNDLATKHLERLIEVDPTHHRAYRLLAEIAEQHHDYLRAKELYETVIVLHPEAKGIYYKLGLITAGFYSDKSKLAAKYFKRAIKQDKHNDDATYRLALLQYEQLHQPKKAVKNLLKTLKINAQHPFANYDLAILYHRRNDLESAAEFYQRAWQINPELKTAENDIAFKYEPPAPAMAAAGTTAPVQRPGTGQTVLITGATSGIGRATAEIFARQGYRLIITGRRADRLEQLVNEFEDNHDIDITSLNFDVRNIEAVKSALNTLTEEWQHVDLLINNAGLAKGYDPIHEGNLDHWETMIDTNIKGLLYLTRAIAPQMVKRRSGQIINICSTAGKEVYPNGNVYCATKHAVDALTQAMRVDLHKYNIRVGQVSPGHVEETEFAFVRFDDAERAKIYEDFTPLRASDVAEAIYYMATCPAHVNIQDILMTGTQQANSNFIDRSGRK